MYYYPYYSLPQRVTKKAITPGLRKWRALSCHHPLTTTFHPRFVVVHTACVLPSLVTNLFAVCLLLVEGKFIVLPRSKQVAQALLYVSCFSSFRTSFALLLFSPSPS